MTSSHNDLRSASGIHPAPRSIKRITELLTGAKWALAINISCLASMLIVIAVTFNVR